MSWALEECSDARRCAFREVAVEIWWGVVVEMDWVMVGVQVVEMEGRCDEMDMGVKSKVGGGKDGGMGGGGWW